MPSAAPEEDTLSHTAIRQAIGAAPLADFSRTIERIGCDRECLGVAVSGGPDSTALLLLCAACDWPGGVRIATVDHGLRAESGAEAERVAALCARIGLPHSILRVTVPKVRGGLQAAARDARYAALADWCPGRWLFTAHHRDDVAEGLLMRLTRGSGVTGLARMREVVALRPDGPMLVRPLLDWSKADLTGICARVGIGTVRDPSNDDPRFDRTAARAILARSPWLDPRQLERAARNLADADDALGWAAERLWHDRVTQDETGFALDARDLPHDIKRRLVERIVAAFAGPDHDRRIETLVRTLDAGDHGMVADVAAVPGPIWRFRRAPPRRTI